MRLALIAHHPPGIDVDANAAPPPPRDRTSRTAKALAHCKAEWTAAYEIAQQKGLPAAKALRMASVAYKLAMPKMDGLPAIKAYISCIAQGIALEVFDGRDGSQLHGIEEVQGPLVRQTPAAARLARILNNAAAELWDTCTIADAPQMYEDARAIASRILAACPIE